MAFLATFSLAGLETAFPFLAYDRLGSTTRSVGYIFAVMGIAGSIVQGGLIGPIRKRIGEERMIPVGLLISAMALVLIALSQSAIAGTAALSLFAVGHGLIRPANAVPDHPAHQGGPRPGHRRLRFDGRFGTSPRADRRRHVVRAARLLALLWSRCRHDAGMPHLCGRRLAPSQSAQGDDGFVGAYDE